MMPDKRAVLVALALLAGCISARPAAAQVGDQLAGYSFRRVEVRSGARIAPSLADHVRDALATRLAPNAGIPALLSIVILDSKEAADGQLHLWAIVSVSDLASGQLVTEFDAEASTPATPAGREALQAEALADSVARLLTQR